MKMYRLTFEGGIDAVPLALSPTGKAYRCEYSVLFTDRADAEKVRAELMAAYAETGAESYIYIESLYCVESLEDLGNLAE